MNQEQERDGGGGSTVVVVQQELELLQVDHCHIGWVQVDLVELLVGMRIETEVGDDIKETGSEGRIGQPPANLHYRKCARWQQLSQIGVADSINRCPINSANKLKCCTIYV